MADDKISITFTCSRCGPTVLTLADEGGDERIASCKQCGQEFGSFGEVKARAVEEAKQKVLSDLKGALKKGGWKTK